MDILPEDSPTWQYIEETARRVTRKYGFSEIRFPTFESTELFQRGVGGTTDVVQKEMYTFTDREGRSFTLRPEGTACVARSLIENGKCSDTMPLKLFYLLFTLIRLALPVLVVVGLILVLRAVARRRNGQTGYSEKKAKEPEFNGPVYTVDYEEVDEDT